MGVLLSMLLSKLLQKERNCSLHGADQLSFFNWSVKRAVQGLITYLKTNCIERGTTDDWSLHLREDVLFSNTKDAKIHGYAPAEIILGFTPQLIYFDISATPLPDQLEAEIKEVPFSCL